LDPNILVGKPIINGTRISIEFVVDLLARGWSQEQVLCEFNHLTLEDLNVCLAYANDVLKAMREAGPPR